jgi:hypothetical protein
MVWRLLPGGMVTFCRCMTIAPHGFMVARYSVTGHAAMENLKTL